MSTSDIQEPQSRNDFRVAVICALSSEAGMVELVLDQEWKKKYGKAPGDANAYTTGAIGGHNVVLTYMPAMGSIPASQTASGLKSSYRKVEIVFVVGICGVMPIHPETREEVVLGDCIISTALVQYDFGRQYPGQFIRKATLEDTLGRANSEIRAFLAKLKTPRNRRSLKASLVEHLHTIQASEDGSDIRYPGADRDRLFDSSYHHIHRPSRQHCESCSEEGICGKSCEAIGCEAAYLIRRQRLVDVDTESNARYLPVFHFGRIGSANTVLKSGEDRDRLSKDSQLAGFEMEGSGVWDALPTIVLKSACDYADSHKNKQWQPYAAATAAAGLKAVLEKLELSDSELPSGS